MEIYTEYSLKTYNTFGIPAVAEFFAQANSIDEIKELLSWKKNKNLFVLGGGSNILLMDKVPGITLQISLKGIEIIQEDNEGWLVKAYAGENWHQFVMHCIDKGYAGLENLSLIPGNVGASPMQNIGAYGVELKDVFHSLEALNVHTLESRVFLAHECEFDYRSSIFKTHEKGNYIITSVNFKLLKNPVFHTSYGAIEQELEAMGIKELSIRAISDAVIRIRQSKLPDPAQLGNAGSFFKNPIISVQHFNKLKEKYTSIPGYPQPNNQIKVPAGWLIEQAGWKGKRLGNCGVHVNQALVLVNYGNASGMEILKLSEEIIQDISSKFNILLEREVNVVGEAKSS
ncbi:MAG: UDP-N-acetylmuramate dehydrogenase [Flavobacteriales bacterium]|nr:UDP-N-acetylmuramate dehydrogenase [Flavobacteriales bacterium]